MFIWCGSVFGRVETVKRAFLCSWLVTRCKERDWNGYCNMPNKLNMIMIVLNNLINFIQYHQKTEKTKRLYIIIKT